MVLYITTVSQPSINRKFPLHGRGFADWKLIPSPGLLLPITGAICSGCSMTMNNIPASFSLPLPAPLIWCFTWQSHRISHETGSGSEVLLLACIPEWQTAGCHCQSWNSFAWSCKTTKLQCTGKALSLLILLLQGCPWWGHQAGKKNPKATKILLCTERGIQSLWALKKTINYFVDLSPAPCWHLLGHSNEPWKLFAGWTTAEQDAKGNFFILAQSKRLLKPRVQNSCRTSLKMSLHVHSPQVQTPD